MNQKNNQRLHARVIGRVQGVGFRYFVLTEANDLGLTGWVRNRRDGSVEVVAEGEQNQLDLLVEAVKRGSRSSHVQDVQVSWTEGSGEFPGFSARPTI